MDFDTERPAAGLGTRAREVGEAVDVAEKRFEQFTIDAQDFLSARERGGTTGTSIEQASASLADAAEILNRSFPERGASGQFINVISPVVIPARQSLFTRRKRPYRNGRTRASPRTSRATYLLHPRLRAVELRVATIRTGAPRPGEDVAAGRAVRQAELYATPPASR